jgi:hypothetical protein
MHIQQQNDNNGGENSDCYLLMVNLQWQINCKQLSKPTTRQKNYEIITEAITSKKTNMNSFLQMSVSKDALIFSYFEV